MQKIETEESQREDKTGIHMFLRREWFRVCEYFVK